MTETLLSILKAYKGVLDELKATEAAWTEQIKECRSLRAKILEKMTDKQDCFVMAVSEDMYAVVRREEPGYDGTEADVCVQFVPVIAPDR